MKTWLLFAVAAAAATSVDCAKLDNFMMKLPPADHLTKRFISSKYEVAESKGRFFNLLLWPLKRVWRTFVVRQVVPALLGAKVAVLWPTLFVLVGLFESALAGLLFFYFLFSSAVSLPTASPKIDLVSPLKPQPPLAQYWWYEQPTAEPYRTISQEDVELMESTQGSSFLQNETKYESSTNFVEEKSTDSWAFKTNDNPQVTYYSAYTN